MLTFNATRCFLENTQPVREKSFSAGEKILKDVRIRTYNPGVLNPATSPAICDASSIAAQQHRRIFFESLSVDFSSKDLAAAFQNSVR